MTDDMPRRARELQLRLRGLKGDDELKVSMADLVLIDRALAALIDSYARTDTRAAMRQATEASTL